MFVDMKYSSRVLFVDMKYSSRVLFVDMTYSSRVLFVDMTYSSRVLFVDMTYSSRVLFVDMTYSSRVLFVDMTYSSRVLFVDMTYSLLADILRHCPFAGMQATLYLPLYCLLRCKSRYLCRCIACWNASRVIFTCWYTRWAIFADMLDTYYFWWCKPCVYWAASHMFFADL